VKTISIKKRIALGTVVAVAAGLLTTVAATTANAVGTGTTWSNAGTTIKWFTNDANGTASVAANNAVGSTGVIANAFAVQGTTAASGAILASGRLGLSIATPAADVRDTLVLTGAQVIGSANGSHSTLTVSTDGTKVDVLADATAGGTTAGILIAPTVAAGGTISITRYAGVTTQFGGSASVTFNASVSVVASSVAGTVSTAKSFAYLNVPNSTADTNAWDEPTGFTLANGSYQAIQFSALDAYGIAASGGYLNFSSDNCYVGLSQYSTSKTGFDATATSGHVYVSQAVANTAATCVVTISYAGTVIGTKTVKFLGDIASLTATSGGINSISDAAANRAAGLLSVVAKDAAGNVVPTADATIDSGSNAYVTTLDNTGAGYNTSSLARAILGKGETTTWTCGTLAGSASVVLKTTNAAGATIKAAPVTLACGNDADSYTIATDKTSYAAGDIATVTITFKDVAGGVPNDVKLYLGNTVASGAWAAANGGFVTAPAALGDSSTSGVLKYKMIVGQTAGTFPVVVSVPNVNTAAHGADQTASITVTSQANDAVSQLVKVVGTLLTSFTKQIAALIKALSKKK